MTRAMSIALEINHNGTWESNQQAVFPLPGRKNLQRAQDNLSATPFDWHCEWLMDFFGAPGARSPMPFLRSQSGLPTDVSPITLEKLRATEPYSQFQPKGADEKGQSPIRAEFACISIRDLLLIDFNQDVRPEPGARKVPLAAVLGRVFVDNLQTLARVARDRGQGVRLVLRFDGAQG